MFVQSVRTTPLPRIGKATCHCGRTIEIPPHMQTWEQPKPYCPTCQTILFVERSDSELGKAPATEPIPESTRKIMAETDLLVDNFIQQCNRKRLRIERKIRRLQIIAAFAPFIGGIASLAVYYLIRAIIF